MEVKGFTLPSDIIGGAWQYAWIYNPYSYFGIAYSYFGTAYFGTAYSYFAWDIQSLLLLCLGYTKATPTLHGI